MVNENGEWERWIRTVNHNGESQRWTRTMSRSKRIGNINITLLSTKRPVPTPVTMAALGGRMFCGELPLRTVSSRCMRSRGIRWHRAIRSRLVQAWRRSARHEALLHRPPYMVMAYIVMAYIVMAQAWRRSARREALSHRPPCNTSKPRHQTLSSDCRFHRKQKPAALGIAGTSCADRWVLGSDRRCKGHSSAVDAQATDCAAGPLHMWFFDWAID